LVLPTDEKRGLVELSHPEIPIYRQCELLGLSRSSFYYKPRGVSEYNHLLMGMIDKEYTAHPFYGILRMTAYLREQGYQVNHKRVGRLMQLMGIRAIYPKPRLSKGVENSEKFPYLLRGMVIQRPNQVWGTDITYIKLRQGFIYLVAVMDWFSRYVLSWEISNSLDSFFCMSALERALAKGTPEIFNSDQGVQFTSKSFTGRLKEGGIRISQDGKGRFWDNIFIERLWRSVKYEEVYLKDYANVPEAIGELSKYFSYYNTQRPHQALGYRTPEKVFFKQ
jgi:putative transposase